MMRVVKLTAYDKILISQAEDADNLQLGDRLGSCL